MKFIQLTSFFLISLFSFSSAEEIIAVDLGEYGQYCPREMAGHITCDPHSLDQYIMCLGKGEIQVRKMDPGWWCQGGNALFTDNTTSTFPVKFIRTETTTKTKAVTKRLILPTTNVGTITHMSGGVSTLPVLSGRADQEMTPDMSMYGPMCPPELTGQFRCDPLFPDQYVLCLGNGSIKVRRMDAGWNCQGGKVTIVGDKTSTLPIQFMRVETTTIVKAVSKRSDVPITSVQTTTNMPAAASTSSILSSLAGPSGDDYHKMCPPEMTYQSQCDPWNLHQYFLCLDDGGFEFHQLGPGWVCQGGNVTVVGNITSILPVHFIPVEATTTTPPSLPPTTDMSITSTTPITTAQTITNIPAAVSTLATSASMTNNNSSALDEHYVAVCSGEKINHLKCDPLNPSKFVVCRQPYIKILDVEVGMNCYGGQTISVNGTNSVLPVSFVRGPTTTSAMSKRSDVPTTGMQTATYASAVTDNSSASSSSGTNKPFDATENYDIICAGKKLYHVECDALHREQFVYCGGTGSNGFVYLEAGLNCYGGYNVTESGMTSTVPVMFSDAPKTTSTLDMAAFSVVASILTASQPPVGSTLITSIRSSSGGSSSPTASPSPTSSTPTNTLLSSSSALVAPVTSQGPA